MNQLISKLFIEEQMMYLKSDLMVMLGYVLDNGKWIKIIKVQNLITQIKNYIYPML